jgi:hypothetical protein
MNKSYQSGFVILYLAFTIFLSLLPVRGIAQRHAFLNGVVTDTTGKPIEGVHIYIQDLNWRTYTKPNGGYRLKSPYEQSFAVIFSHVSFNDQFHQFTLGANEERSFDVMLIPGSVTLTPFVFRADATHDMGMTTVPLRVRNEIPSPSGNQIEALIMRTAVGVYGRNELSSQYSVRGGNFDENLIYVNGIEVIRPLLVRSGQQEGLSFVNADLTESVWFSAGGFSAKYGDKMASVLDARYRVPDGFMGSAQMSLLGGSVFLQDAPKGKNISYLFGFRQKSNQYLLKSMETSGDYKPSFTDVQTYITYRMPDGNSTLSFLGNYARNKYTFIPSTRETRFGTWNEVLRFKVYFSGQEVDKFESGFAALDYTWRPTDSLSLSLVTSVFRSNEFETFDILGQYWLDELNTSLGSDEFGEVAFNRGVGTFLQHARNYLMADVINTELKGQYRTSGGFHWEWGAQHRNERIEDKLLEWYMVDSAGYSLPHPPDSIGYTDPSAQSKPELLLQEYLKSQISLNTNRYSAFVQNTWTNGRVQGKPWFSINLGVRANYWDYTNQLLVSPRIVLAMRPGRRNHILYRFSAGLYYQPPFYREMRDIDGTINPDIKAQESLHLVAGTEWDLRFWQRPFKLVGEVYYKDMKNLIPYEFDNIRIRYFSRLVANGYAVGLDLKLNGELVPGIESWVGVSLMQTKEDILGDYYFDYYNQHDSLIIWGQTKDTDVAYAVLQEGGYKPRPTDQLLNFNLFFQDYLPSIPDLKAHLNLVWGSRIPFGPPKTKNIKYPGRTAAYRRVDIGFSKMIFSGRDTTKSLPRNFPFKYMDRIWLSFEVFNLLQFSNTMGYTWITDVNNNQYAIPSRLTPRQVNFKLLFEF